jgi:hypothetical protein
MTLATPDVDFGTALGITNVNVKSAGHPFTLGISGLQQVALGSTGIAWAKPSTDALIAVNLPRFGGQDDTTKSLSAKPWSW